MHLLTSKENKSQHKNVILVAMVTR